ncbi:MAG: quinate 5-dehydrogenase [Firmicutes bacterium]|nr:quinate 5-dehydrogenase [Bacillota bacterium]
MKRIVSVSLGSSKRDKTVTATLLGHEFTLERIGCDGDVQRMMRLIADLDGKVDALGLGGIDLYLFGGGRRYTIRDGMKIASVAKKTPVFDGSYLKNTWEKRVILEICARGTVDLSDKNALITSATDRPGMADALASSCRRVLFGDLIFALGIPVPIYSQAVLNALAAVLAPLIVKLPFKWLYPTGERQDVRKPKHRRYFDWADVIAGDWHYIRRYMPDEIPGKIVISNTLTTADVEDLRERGAKVLITTTPELDGRSFGTNVMEAAVALAAGLDPRTMTLDSFAEVVESIDFEPRVTFLQEQKQ